MSIAITCPSCGAKANASDAAAGKRAKCRACGTVIQIPVPPPPPPAQPAPPAPKPEPVPPKLCVRCGADVTHQQRVKDDVGHYYCQPCWDLINQPAPAMEAVAARGPSVDPMHDDWAQPMADPAPINPAAVTDESTEEPTPTEQSPDEEPAASDFQTAASGDPGPEPEPEAPEVPPAALDRARAASMLGYSAALTNTSKAKVPDYAGLKWAASCFGFISLLNFILAVLAATAYGIRIYHDFLGTQFDLVGELPNILGCAGSVIGFLVIALIFRAVSHAILAFRDIARNSWFMALGQLPH